MKPARKVPMKWQISRAMKRYADAATQAFEFERLLRKETDPRCARMLRKLIAINFVDRDYAEMEYDNLWALTTAEQRAAIYAGWEKPSEYEDCWKRTKVA